MYLIHRVFLLYFYTYLFIQFHLVLIDINYVIFHVIVYINIIQCRMGFIIYSSFPLKSL